MLFTSEFDGGLPVGTEIQGGGLGPAEPLWLCLDGRQLSRAVVENALLSLLFPVGKLTGTIRTLAASPAASSPCIAVGANLVAAGIGNTTNAIQYSADNGASWNTVTTLALTLAGLVATPTRLVALSTGANTPMVSANLSPASAWSATASGPSSISNASSYCRAAFAAVGPGRAIAVHNTLGLYTLDEGSTTWAARASSSAKTGAAWSGQRVVGITAGSAVISLSTDAINYTDALLPEALSANQGNIASDGNGTLVISGLPSGLLVSVDHGATWQFVQIPGVPASDLWRVQFSGGYFMLMTTQGLAISPNGKKWFIDPTTVQTLAVGTALAKIGSVILQVPGGSTTAYTMVESATDFLLPNRRLMTPANSGNPVALSPTYIKAL